MVSAGSVENIIEIFDENEPEEGEIVDERIMDDTNVYETISSDDEVNLRERIAELEARNLELEKIAMISKYEIGTTVKENYINDIQSATDEDDYQHYYEAETIKTNSKKYKKSTEHDMHINYHQKHLHGHHHHHHNNHHHHHRHHQTQHIDDSFIDEDIIEIDNIKYNSKLDNNNINDERNYMRKIKKSSRKKKKQHRLVSTKAQQFSSTKRTTNNAYNNKNTRKITNNFNRYYVDDNDEITDNYNNYYKDNKNKNESHLYKLNREELKTALNKQKDSNNTSKTCLKTKLNIINKNNNTNTVMKNIKLPKTASSATKLLHKKIKKDNMDINETSSEIIDYITMINENNECATNGSISEEITVSDSDDESVSLEEQQLRLIALKSAVIKKFELRRKCNKFKQQQIIQSNSPFSSPYSPTDNTMFEPFSSNDYQYRLYQEQQQQAQHQQLNQDESENMEISPAVSPIIIDSRLQPIDMDLVSSDNDYDDNNINTNDQPFGQHELQDIPLPIDNKLYINNNNEQLINDNENNSNIDDEEENALRTLLLAKLKETKLSKLKLNNNKENMNNINIDDCNSKIENISKEHNDNNNKNHSNNNEIIIEHNSKTKDYNIENNNDDIDASVEEDDLRNLLLSSLNKRDINLSKSIQHKKETPLPEEQNENKLYKDIAETDLNIPKMTNFLKEAVKRIQNKNQLKIDNSIMNDIMTTTTTKTTLSSLTTTLSSSTTQFLNVIDERVIVNKINTNDTNFININSNDNDQNNDKNDIINSNETINIAEANSVDPNSIISNDNVSVNKHCTSSSNDTFSSTTTLTTVSTSANTSTITTTTSTTSIPNKDISVMELKSPQNNKLNIKNIVPVKKIINDNNNNNNNGINNVSKMSSSTALSSTPSSSLVLVKTNKKIINKTSPKSTNNINTNKRKIVSTSAIATSGAKQIKLDKSINKNITSNTTNIYNNISNNSNNNNNYINNNNNNNIGNNLNRPPVNKLIIRLGYSDSDSDEQYYSKNNYNNNSKNNNNYIDDDEFNINSPKNILLDNLIDEPSLNNYNSNNVDIIKSINQETSMNAVAATTTTTTAQPPQNNPNGNASEEFALVVDAFLKTARNRVEQQQQQQQLQLQQQQTKIPIDNNNIKTKVKPVKQQQTPKRVRTISKTLSVTPSAVRHLPESSQLEYRLLVNRMKMLENKKKLEKANNLNNKTVIDKDLSVTMKNDKIFNNNSIKKSDIKITINNKSNRIIQTVSATPSVDPTICNLDVSKQQQQQPNEQSSKSGSIKNITNSKIQSQIENNINNNNNNNLVDVPPPSFSISTENTSNVINNETLLSPSNIDANTKNNAMTDINIINNILIGTDNLNKINYYNNMKVKEYEIDNLNEMDNTEKLELLKNMENNYINYSTTLICNLNKVFHLISNAQLVERKQHELEKQYELLQLQMKQIENEIGLQKNHIKKILPIISESHKSLTNGYEKYTIISDNCKNIGKTVKGADYKIPDEDNHGIINEKLKTISDETINFKQLQIEKSITRSDEPKQFNNNTDVDIMELPTPTPLSINNNPNKDVSETNKLPSTVANNNPSIDNELDAMDNLNVVHSLNSIPNDKEIVINKIQNEYLEEMQSHQNNDIINIANEFEKNIQKTTIVTVSTSRADASPLSLHHQMNTTIDQSTKNLDKIENNKIIKYQSPLDYMKIGSCSNNFSNPNDVICPFELMGQCEDTECKYFHLNGSSLSNENNT